MLLLDHANMTGAVMYFIERGPRERKSEFVIYVPH